jgi:hypothetical protein
VKLGSSRAVSNVVFASSVIVLLIVAASGFFLYSTRSSMTETTTVTVTGTDSMTQTGSSSSEAMNGTGQASSVAFSPSKGQMFGEGWVVIAPVGDGDYLVSVYAQGLEGPSMGDYIVEGAQNTGNMSMVPIGGSNATLSEFEAGSGGVGQLSTLLMENPSTQFESISIVYLPAMEMTNATVVATATLSMSSGASTT